MWYMIGMYWRAYTKGAHFAPGPLCFCSLFFLDLFGSFEKSGALIESRDLIMSTPKQ